jgi:hypothetical protein
MCLACELEALWYAESERLAAEGKAGVTPAPAGEPEAGHAAPAAGVTPAAPASPAAPLSRFFCEEAE